MSRAGKEYDSMYNQTLKEAFLSTVADKADREACTSLFRRLAVSEKELNKDICQMSRADLKPVLDGILAKRKDRGFNILQTLQAYVSYCRSLGVMGVTTAVDEYEPEMGDRFLESYVANPLDLSICHDQLYGPVDGITSDLILRCYEWLAFFGVPEADIPGIRVSDVDFTDRTVTDGATGNTYYIYREAMPVFEAILGADRFRIKRYGGEDGPVYRYYKRIDSPQLLRGIKREQTAALLTKNAALARRDAVGQGKTIRKLNYGRLWESGWFYRSFEREMARIDTQLDKMCDEYIRTHEFSDEVSADLQWRTVAKRLKHTYRVWKAAFRV